MRYLPAGATRNPVRPPKEWFYFTLESLKKESRKKGRKKMADMEAVVANIWHNTMRDKTRKKILDTIMRNRSKGRKAVATTDGTWTRKEVTALLGKAAAKRIYSKLKLTEKEIAEAKNYVRDPGLRKQLLTTGRAPARRAVANPGYSPRSTRSTRRSRKIYSNPRKVAPGYAKQYASYSPKEKGIRIENQPYPNIGTQTGWFYNDYYGTWYEVVRDSDGSTFWMIGEPKEQKLKHRTARTEARATRRNLGRLWLQIGGGDYEDFGIDLDAVAERLKMFDVNRIRRSKWEYGVESQEFKGTHRIELFWGDEEASRLAEITDKELAEINSLLREKRSRRNPSRRTPQASRLNVRRRRTRRNPELMLMMNPGEQIMTLAEMKRDPEFQAIVAKHIEIHGCEPEEVIAIQRNTPGPRYLCAMGETPEAIYQVKGYSKKAGKNNLPYKHDFENPVVLAIDATGKHIEYVPLTDKTFVDDWMRG